ncbi:unnamed protein product [Ectocarpus sp. CCAP 1310/34]|nr:unnamed protein product [Ectocarpus sp. CCAP 1310/34]
MPTQPNATLSKDSLEDGLVGRETREKSPAAGWGSRRGEEPRSGVPRTDALGVAGGSAPPREDIDEGSPPQTLSALRREALDPTDDEEQDENEASCWEGGGGGGGGRAGPAAGGSGGGNPARGVPNKLFVRRRPESFKESVSTGLAHAIAEMQTGLPSDDDVGGVKDVGRQGASKEKRSGGDQQATLRGGWWSAGADSGGGGLLKSDDDGGSLNAGAAGRTWPRTNPKQLPFGVLSEGSSVASSAEGFELPESFSMGLMAKEGGGGGERRGPAVGGGASPIGSQASRASSKKRSTSSGKSSRSIGVSGRGWDNHPPPETKVVTVTAGRQQQDKVAAGGREQVVLSLPSLGVGSKAAPNRRGPAAPAAAASDRCPSPASSVASSVTSASSRASSSLATSMRTKSRRGRRSESRVTRGTRPEREAGGSGRQWQQGGGGGGGGGANDGQGSQQRTAAAAADGRGGRGQPSPGAPLRLGGRELRRGGSSGSSRRGRKKTGNEDRGAASTAARGSGGRGEVGLRAGMASSGRFRLGRVGRGSGMTGGRASGRDWRGKELSRNNSTVSSEGDEMHYVNPMNLQRRSAPHINLYPKGGSSGGGSGSAHSEHRGHGLPKLLRKFTFLRRSWRGGKQQGQGTTERSKGGLNNGAMNQRMGSLADKALRTSVGGKGSGDGGISGPEELGLGATADLDGKELDMACRRLLDALWMSAKRGSDTFQLSVVDGRALLSGLLVGLAPPPPFEINPATGKAKEKEKEEELSPSPLVDLGIPLPRALAALTAARAAGTAAKQFGSTPGLHQKAMRPVLVGASGPFARAAREAGRGGSSWEGSTRSSSSVRRRETAALQRAMELAMGVESEKEVKARRMRERATEGGATTAMKDKMPSGEVDKHKEWLTSPYRPAPSEARVQGRQLASRARVHRELRNASAAVGHSLGTGGGGGGKRGTSPVGGSEKGASTGGGSSKSGWEHRRSSFPLCQARKDLHTAVSASSRRSRRRRRRNGGGSDGGGSSVGGSEGGGFDDVGGDGGSGRFSGGDVDPASGDGGGYGGSDADEGSSSFEDSSSGEGDDASSSAWDDDSSGVGASSSVADSSCTADDDYGSLGDGDSSYVGNGDRRGVAGRG